MQHTPQQGALLLRSGEAIEGKISRVGDLYYVALPNGEIRVQAAEVELCCRDLEDGYRHKRAAIRVGSAHDHLRLAQWCLRHDLLGPAARELADALAADPSHPMIGVLERRLKLAMQPGTGGQGVGTGEQGSGFRVQGSVCEDQPSAFPHSRDRCASPEDLDRLVRGMPAGSVETFTQTVQPVLINNCTAAGCHGPGSETDFCLLRIPADKPPSRLVTQRNLHATLQWVDWQQPAASQLLIAPIRPHGTAKTAIFTSAQADQYRRIVDWVNQLAESPAPKTPATIAPLDEPPIHAMPAEPPGLLPSAPEALPLKDRQPAAASPTLQHSGTGAMPVSSGIGVSPVSSGIGVSPVSSGIGVSPVKRGAPLPGFVPADPFDPEIFNRRFFHNESPGGAGG